MRTGIERLASPLVSWSLALAFTAVHVVHVFTENINWDEFAAMKRAALMLRTHRLQGGGRPGAIEFLLAPFVNGCRDGVRTIQDARLLWVLVTAIGLAGLYRLLRMLREGRANPARGAVLGVALMALALPFLRWSLQIRTDQLAMACGVWGGVGLLASRRRASLAALAGVSFGIGFLFTQKLLYLGGLMATLAVLQPWLLRAGSVVQGLRSLVLRALLCLAAFGAVLGAYKLALPVESARLNMLPIQGGMRTLQHYREAFGWQLHLGMLSGLKPHALLLVALVAVTLQRLRRPGGPGRSLLVAWLVLAMVLGLAVVHSGFFPYFWITLGVFVAVAFGLCLEELAEAVPERLRPLLGLGLAASLVLPASFYSATLLWDSQGAQRESLRFVNEEFGVAEVGLQAEGALFCRNDLDPYRIMFREHIERTFSGPASEHNIDTWLRMFRAHPLHFLIHSHAISLFPRRILDFWARHYHPYFSSVWVAGAHLGGAAGEHEQIELVVPGSYRWLPFPDHDDAILQVDGSPLQPGATLELEAGMHSVVLPDGVEGRLLFACSNPVRLGGRPFYSSSAVREVVGEGYD